MPKLDLDSIPQTNATGYPPEFADKVQERWYRALAPAAGLKDFGVSHVELKPGAWSSQRHWHEGEDEFVVLVEGEAVLVDDSGRTALRPGDCAAFPKGDGNGHVLVNESEESCVFIAVGKPAASDCHYSDIDMHLEEGRGFRRKDGSGF
ncbi:cupin domain-containing protein [Parasphingopyxis lamellibrachiae]|uniref:Putative cupin superfamily protein n=1 Tax=Parasphingopyxis lamellibrachiae TaxID=680125 RepID=A0A3D9FC76_9SPHN|nr:cupin domain-containing protein [Parasphingopyxis lamellibrachiae]RED15333.1 putative cupin superfamily protein [Parasphingopyxis lamellibrachiae]